MAINLSGQPFSNFKKILIIVLDIKVQLCFAICLSLEKFRFCRIGVPEAKSHYPYDLNLHSEGKSLTFKNCSGLQLSSNCKFSQNTQKITTVPFPHPSSALML